MISYRVCCRTSLSAEVLASVNISVSFRVCCRRPLLAEVLASVNISVSFRVCCRRPLLAEVLASVNISVSFRVCCTTSLSAIVLVPEQLSQLSCLLQKSFGHLPRVLQNTIITDCVCCRTPCQLLDLLHNILVTYRGCYRTALSVTVFVTEHTCQLPCLLQDTCTSSYRIC